MTREAFDHLDDIAVSALRVLSVQQIEQANSGHPGMPLGAADAAYVIWTRFLRYNPEDPDWMARDRFVLSAGHASALLYSLLHLAGYDLSIEDLSRFRQLGSRTPGHPERGTAPGVELTTGPLGQGLASSVGIALGLKMLSARFSSPSFPGLPSRVWVLASDGDMMEGISSEAGSMAAHLGLDNLFVVYDSNRITINGNTSLAFTESVTSRFRSFGWTVFETDGHDKEALAATLEKAQESHATPVLVVSKTLLAKHVPGREGDHRLHGSPVGPEGVKGLLEALHWPEDSPFRVPDEAYEPFRRRARDLKAVYGQWQKNMAQWKQTEPEEAALLESLFDQPLPHNLEEILMEAVGRDQKATRVHSGLALNAAATHAPWLIGGSADLTSSNKAEIHGASFIERGSFGGRNIHFGIREHCMAAVANGLAAMGAFKPYVATFLVFSDYMRPSIRLATLMKLPVIYIFTHDSIYVGEDGPTHQPIEHLAALRAIPGLTVIRPADGPEVAAAWAWALQKKDGPVVLALTRQKVDTLPHATDSIPPVPRGAYVIVDVPTPHLVLVATGSEVALALRVSELLANEDLIARVVSMPCIELFLQQPTQYRRSVIPGDLPVVAMEAAVGLGWTRIIGRQGLLVGMEEFGASAPAEVLSEHFGFTPQKIASRIRTWYQKRSACKEDS